MGKTLYKRAAAYLFVLIMLCAIALFSSCINKNSSSIEDVNQNTNGDIEKEEQGEQSSNSSSSSSSSSQNPSQGEEKNNDEDIIEYEKSEAFYNVNYGEDGNPYQEMDIYVPEYLIKTQTAAPVIITIHGGNWIDGFLNRNSYNHMTPFINSCGYVHVNMDYRLSTVSPQGNGIGVAEMLNDITSAIDYLTNNATSYNIEPSKIALMGYSAGGHLALLYSYIYPERVSLVVSEAGPTDLYAAFNDAQLEWKNLFINLAGGNYVVEFDQEKLKDISPLWILNSVSDISILPYTVLAYGSNNLGDPTSSTDGVVPYAQGFSIYQNLYQFNKATMFELENITHMQIGENATVCPSSNDIRSKEYYYGSENNNFYGLKQIISQYLNN